MGIFEIASAFVWYEGLSLMRVGIKACVQVILHRN
jgi:hypothetical protein